MFWQYAAAGLFMFLWAVVMASVGIASERKRVAQRELLLVKLCQGPKRIYALASDCKISWRRTHALLLDLVDQGLVVERYVADADSSRYGELARPKEYGLSKAGCVLAAAFVTMTRMREERHLRVVPNDLN